MSNRILSFRAALVLLLASAVIIWPISYWFPLPGYLSALNSEEYAPFALTLKGILATYLVFLLMNLLSAGLAFTKLDQRIKLALVSIPTVLLVALPLILVIPVTQKVTDKDYFTLLQGIYRLLRFTTPELLLSVLLVTLLSVGLNILAAILIFKDKSVDSADEVPLPLRKRYGIYAGVLVLAFLISGLVNFVGSNARALDRIACFNYSALQVPETDQGVPNFLSDIQLYGDAAGTQDVKDAMVVFASYSRQYYYLMGADDPGVDLNQLAAAISIAKDKIVEVCSPYSVQ